MLLRTFLNDARSLIAAVSDASQPRDRARTAGVYRFWRDFGFVLGALIAGISADAASPQSAIAIVALLTGEWSARCCDLMATAARFSARLRTLREKRRTAPMTSTRSVKEPS